MEDYRKKPSETYRDPGAETEPYGQPPADGWSQSAHGQTVQQAPSGRHPRPSRPRASAQVSERKARLTLTLFAASLAVLVIGLVVFFTVRTLRNDDDPVSGPGVTTPEEAARAVGGIGPPPGVDLGTYVETRKAALAQATGDRVAVVSLSEYSTAANARELVGSAEVLALLAAAPGGQPALVTGDIAGWVDSQTADARAERDEIQKLIPTVRGDPEFQSFYRSEVDRLDNLIDSIDPEGDLVFGVVVRAPAPFLQELGSRGEVRLVDVGPSADPGPRPTYRGIRPEETVKANEPNTRPL